MSLAKVSDRTQKKVPKRPLSREEFKSTSESIIERDFFPILYETRKRSESVIDLTEPTRLDDFNDSTVSKDTVKLLDSLEKSKSLRHERFHGSQERGDWNVFMFNHPGIAGGNSRRSKINYANTRFPDSFQFDQSGPAKNRPTRGRNIHAREDRFEDILKRGTKHK
jgi:hypothetical protein